jgi:hypothetical protein
MADWVTISALATAGGTLALAGATYASVRSSNRSARVAEQALQEQRRPLLVGARLDDPEQTTSFTDGRWIRTQGAQAVLDEDGDTVYLGIPVRNAGAGIAVLQGWHLWPDIVTSAVGHRQPEEFRPQIRDIYIAPGDIGLWQGALREGDREQALSIEAAHTERRPLSIDLLYSDQVGGQRTISRFIISPIGEDGWLASVGLHWNLDAASPR